MRIVNETQYRTDDLRKFFAAGLRSMGADMDKDIWVYCDSRPGWCRGRAQVGTCAQGHRITMWLPKTDPNTLMIAQVFEHEVAHNLGVRHKEMDGLTRWCEQEVTWYEGLELRRAEPKSKPKRDPVAEREAHARKMLQKWERKLKLTKTHLRKWRTKVRYYDRKNTAAGNTEGRTE